LNDRGGSESRLLVFAEGFGEQAACVRAPGKVGIAKPFDGVRVGVELLDRGRQGLAPLGRSEVVGQFEHCWVFEARLAVEIAAGGEDEERPAKCRIPLCIVERNFVARDIGEDDQIDVVQTACSSAIESTSSRIPIPSSISSRVIVSGGQTMITFQWVIR
jgi:hypothetical protein